jgi:small subunit ribosomal protein S20
LTERVKAGKFPRLIIQEDLGMPQHKSCEKRIKQDVKRTARNRAATSNLRTAVKKFRELGADKQSAEYAAFQSLLDRAVGKGIISANRAARLKSRLAPTA